MINTLDEYLEWYSKNIQDHTQDEILMDLFDQIKDLVISIKILLEKDLSSQCFILNRTLGEISILIFVICSLNKKAREGYYAIYELHGLLELTDIFEKNEYEEYKKDKFYSTFQEKMEKLKSIILKEFGEEGEKLTDQQMKKFVNDKLSKHIYGDAEILIEQKYSGIPSIHEMAKDILKNSAKYKLESHPTHGRYLTSILNTLDIKEKIVITDTLKRINLVVAVYEIMK